MNKNLITVGVFATLVLAAFAYIVIDVLNPKDVLEDKENLPTITVLEVNVSETRPRTGRGDSSVVEIEDEDEAREIISEFASANNLSVDDYPYYLVTRMVRNPELTTFVLNYPLYRNTAIDSDSIDVSQEILEATNGIPLYLQWDLRWGYGTYGSDMMALTGCGPTCLSMVATALLDDASLNPWQIAKFSMENGYYDYSTNSGTLWSLMTDGATELGLNVSEVPAMDQELIDALEAGHPVICIMGPGDFTSEGHFIVVTGYKDGYVTVNDPNSVERSETLWPVDTIISQANGMWEYSI